MHYFTVTSEELQSARAGLELVERILGDDRENFTPFLYGTTTKKPVLMDVDETLADRGEEGEAAPSVNEVALAIPLSSDVLYRLTGSGYTLRREEFAYRAGRDDVRSTWLWTSTTGTNVTLNDFDTLALADSDTWVDEFLKEHDVNTGAVPADITVPRDHVPAVKQPEPAKSPEPQRVASSLKPKKAAVRVGMNAIDNFLASVTK